MDIIQIYTDLRKQFCRCKALLPFDEHAVTLYFLPIFYFSSDTPESSGHCHGLLTNDYTLDVNTANNMSVDMAFSNRIGDSAYNFLINNNDPYRAEQLRTFNNILYTMANKAPWHFTELELNIGDMYKNMLEYKYTEGRQLTLKLAPDTIDRMHHTLFHIYKNLCWDTERDVMILPKNLRQFNMGIILFAPPTKFLDGQSLDTYNKVLNQLYENKIIETSHTEEFDKSIYTKFSYKNDPKYDKDEHNMSFLPNGDIFDMSKQSNWWQFIELRGCEFDMNAMFEQLNISSNNTSTSLVEAKEQLVINFKRMYTTTCERFFNISLTDIPSQYQNSYQNVRQTQFGSSKRWNN